MPDKSMRYAICAVIVSASILHAQTRYISLIGNSMADAAFDAARLTSALSSVKYAAFKKSTGTVSRTPDPTYTVAYGVESAFQMAAVYNQCNRTDGQKPSAVLIITRLNTLTQPNVRIWGADGCAATDTMKYRKLVLGAIGSNTALRSIIDSVAYNDSMAQLPVRFPGKYGYKGNHCDSTTINWNFDQANPASFLSRFVSVCKQKNIKLIILFHKKAKMLSGNYYKTFPERDAYRLGMSAFLQKSGAHFIDHSTYDGLDASYYNTNAIANNDDHISAAGQPKYTDLVAEDLKAILSGGRGPRELTNHSSGSAVQVSRENLRHSVINRASAILFGKDSRIPAGAKRLYSPAGKRLWSASSGKPCPRNAGVMIVANGADR